MAVPNGDGTSTALVELDIGAEGTVLADVSTVDGVADARVPDKLKLDTEPDIVGVPIELELTGPEGMFVPEEAEPDADAVGMLDMLDPATGADEPGFSIGLETTVLVVLGPATGTGVVGLLVVVDPDVDPGGMVPIEPGAGMGSEATMPTEPEPAVGGVAMVLLVEFEPGAGAEGLVLVELEPATGVGAAGVLVGLEPAVGAEGTAPVELEAGALEEFVGLPFPLDTPPPLVPEAGSVGLGFAVVPAELP